MQPEEVRPVGDDAGRRKPVAELEELPATFQKKEYRVPGNYKALFRDFNAVFPGVQAERRRSNPAHLAR